ncbi:MAG: hypothetical protein VYC34_12410 [Planctomycetota bacterium]|nr:hypothetical protein [Planctomycetota bacterium]
MSDVKGRSMWSRLAATPMRDVVRGRVSARLDWKGEVERAEAPRVVREFVIRVTRRTRLDRLEKSDVARELMAHFEDGIEAGVDAAALVGSFGDAKDAARLIRRAKKRQRAAWRRWTDAGFKGAGVAALVVVAAYAALAVRFFAGEPTVTRVVLAELHAAALAVPVEERGWGKYKAAFAAIGPVPQEMYAWRTADGRAVSAEERAGLERAFVLGHQEGMAKLREAAGAEALAVVLKPAREADVAHWPQAAPEEEWEISPAVEDALWDRAMLALVLPHVAPMRVASQLLAVDLEAAAESGDGGRAIEDLRAMLGMVGHMREIETIITDLTSASMLMKAIDSFGKALDRHADAFSDAQLQEAAHLFAGAAGGEMMLRLGWERKGFEDLLQRLYTDDGSGDGRLTLEGARALLTFVSSPWDDVPQISLATKYALPVTDLVSIGRAEAQRLYDEIVNQALAEAQIPLWERGPSAAGRRVEAMSEGGIDQLRYAVVTVYAAAYARASASMEKTEMARDAMLVVIALELDRRERGAWAGGLEELAPRFVPRVPRDRFDGGALKYAVRDGEPVVYSVGTDLDDDGGVPPRNAEGHAINERASHWMPREQVEARRGELADGDWMLWPPVPDPPAVEFGAAAGD